MKRPHRKLTHAAVNSVLPPVLAVHREPAEATPATTANAVRIELVVPAEHYFLQGHFPEVPLLPGVVQLTWAVELARRYLTIEGEFVGVKALKFMRVIQPDQPVTLVLNFALGKLQFSYLAQEEQCASGTVLFAPVTPR